jgi:hypothetical protein
MEVGIDIGFVDHHGGSEFRISQAALLIISDGPDALAEAISPLAVGEPPIDGGVSLIQLRLHCLPSIR